MVVVLFISFLFFFLEHTCDLIIANCDFVLITFFFFSLRQCLVRPVVDVHARLLALVVTFTAIDPSPGTEKLKGMEVFALTVFLSIFFARFYPKSSSVIIFEKD